MVEGVDWQCPSAILVLCKPRMPEYPSQHALLIYGHCVRSLFAHKVLAMLYERCILVLDTKVLVYTATQGRGQHLYATANAKDRNLTFISLTYKHQFWHIALGVYAMQLRYGFLAHKQGVHIRPAAKHYAIQRVQQGRQGHGIAIGRNDNRTASCLKDTLVVSLSQFAALVSEIAGYTYKGLHSLFFLRLLFIFLVWI